MNATSRSTRTWRRGAHVVVSLAIAGAAIFAATAATSAGTVTAGGKLCTASQVGYTPTC